MSTVIARIVLIIVVTAMILACTHNTIVEPDDPTHTTLHPTSPTTPTTPTIPALPSMTGTWAGIATVVSSFVGSDFNSCNVVLVVAAQASGQFFGLISFEGGTVSRCSQSGNAFGSIGASGAVSLQFSLNGDQTTCTSVSDGAPLTGVATTDTLTLSQTVHRSCSPSTSAFSQDGIQSLSLSLRR